MSYRAKMLHVGFSNLAYDRAFDIIPSQDPAVSLHVCLPVGNWLNGRGLLRGKFDHPDIVYDEDKGGFFFAFQNHKFRRTERVAVDGSGVMVAHGMTQDLLKKLQREVMLMTKGADRLDTADLAYLVQWLRIHCQITDVRASTRADVRARLHPYDTPRPRVFFGGFLPRPVVSAAIGYKGPVTFELMPGAAEVFEKGGFVVFPTLRAADVRMAGAEGIFALCAGAKVAPQTDAAPALQVRNSMADGSAITVPTFRPWFRARKLG